MIALTTDLRRLGAVKAPPGFADRVLGKVGMADSYARFETVLGDVYVAWNRLGVSAAARSRSAAEFEEWFRHTGLTDVVISWRNKNSWRGFGRTLSNDGRSERQAEESPELKA